jgi:hypothetical protein
LEPEEPGKGFTMTKNLYIGGVVGFLVATFWAGSLPGVSKVALAIAAIGGAVAGALIGLIVSGAPRIENVREAR